MRVADVLPGLIDTAILTSTPSHSDAGVQVRSVEEIRAVAPRRACSG
ncbi:short-chain type dehydrogenase/reductase domain protein [Mycobacterium xenopi 4042]|uniref:Short-chain type dehydrogenase/reductase domain protein n=1 Tax=Mycobacterium xenopi 4042 TaxID=1299334 RepID=X8BEC9_MYCXE|nr:short-chain type dehydrogenase/reductase domain protein [Mycobacterium xenopi 4042]